MEKSNDIYIQDIRKAINKIEDYLEDIDFTKFAQEEMRHDAVIRQLEIIGEAANKLSEEFAKQNPDFPLKEAITMRNFLIHAYDDVDLMVVWKTIQEDIPLLKKRIQSLN